MQLNRQATPVPQKESKAGTPDGSGMELDRETALALQQEGKAAYEAGDPHDSSPYNRFGNAEQQFGYQFWTQGWSMAQSAAEAAQGQEGASAGR